MDKQRKNLLVFGYGLAVILTTLCLKAWWSHGWKLLNTIFIVLAVLMLLITIFNEGLLKKIYDRWMKVAHVIGNTVTGIILSVLFYILFGTIGIILRLMGKDFLDQKIDKTKTTYWVKKEAPLNKDSYKQQF